MGWSYGMYSFALLDPRTHAHLASFRLRALAAEVTRVTLEVGSQGKLGGQAHVPDVEGCGSSWSAMYVYPSLFSAT